MLPDINEDLLTDINSGACWKTEVCDGASK